MKNDKEKLIDFFWEIVEEKEYHKLEKLKKMGFDFNCMHEDFFGDRPLHLAVKWQNLKLAKLFIKYGADINLKNDCGDTPLELIEGYLRDPLDYAVVFEDEKIKKGFLKILKNEK